MRLPLLFLSAVGISAQTQTGILVRSSVSLPASMNVTITSLPNVNRGTTVNLSSATADWRLFANVVSCQAPAYCEGDRALNGSGIMGVYNTGAGDPNYYGGYPTVPAISMSYTDGTNSASGSLGYTNTWLSQSFAIKATADNSVVKTFTSYWVLQNLYDHTPSTSGDGTVQFTFALSDNSVASQTQSVVVTSAAGNGLLKVVTVYNAGADGKELTVSAVKTAGDGNQEIMPLAAMLSSAATGAITRAIPMGSELQGELDAARPGDTLVFPAGYTALGNFVLMRRPVVNDAFGNPLHIKIRAADINLASGQRVLLSEPTVVWTTPNPNPVLDAHLPTVGYWDIDGIRFASLNLGDAGGINYVLVHFGLLDTTGGHGAPIDRTTTTANLPHDITITHCVIHGRDFTPGAGQSILNSWNQFEGIRFDVLRGVLADSNITNFIAPAVNGETSAIIVATGSNILIRNNDVSAAGENIMLYAGGFINISPAEALAVPITGPSSGVMPDHITITGNYIHKLIEWLPIEYTKNLIECKNCRYTHIYGNLLEYSFAGNYSEGQFGNSISVANRNGGCPDDSSRWYTGCQGTARPWEWSHDIEVDHNIQHHQGQCFVVFGPYDDAWDIGGLNRAVAAGMGKVGNIQYHDNLCDDLSEVWTTASGAYPNIAPDFTPTPLRWGGAGGLPINTLVQHNTFLHRETPNVTVAAATAYGVTYNAYTPGSYTDGSINFIDLFTDPNIRGGVSTANEVFDNNIFGWAEPVCAGTNTYKCFSGQDQANITWTNNVMRNVVSSAASWKSFFSGNNAAYAGKWSGNVFSIDNSATNSTAGAPATILSGEAAIRAGGR